MLLEFYDKTKTAIINPSTFHDRPENFPKTCISFFSRKLMSEIVRTYKHEIIAKLSNATMEFPVYKINHNGIDLAVYQSPVGAPASVMCLEEIISMGVKNYILVGCCGCLDKNIDDYSIILPTSAIRDEGTSYHYSPASDEIALSKKCVSIIEKVLKEHKINYCKGKTWTTDAFYRETRNKVKARVDAGAITVDMECSAMAVVSKFRKINFAQIFYAADNLGNESYDPRSLVEDDMVSKKSKVIPLAFECGERFDKLL